MIGHSRLQLPDRIEGIGRHDDVKGKIIAKVKRDRAMG
jgi:hypothetical protein